MRWVTAAAIALAIGSSVANAAEETYSFDSVSRVDVHKSSVSITGILRDTTMPTTITWLDASSGDNRYAINRCVPIFLVMLEKPGRYYLNLIIDEAIPQLQTVSCGLEVRS